ncbi:MAG: winged helix-turn-helix transcriptional regulator [Candidatus Fermentibacteraceae bacterium]|nr:winged helix-turn-helix transcriptional regulator [Candidatus Fermentibacteraceae bacterium]MBN2608534.1 winged helix-turn-helix transcriptional regulator [Candidatus Fermentibacteraceae bacterium]
MNSFEEQSRILKALAHPHRLEIVMRLKEDGCSVSEIQDNLGLPQSTISHHLLILKNAGVLSSRREGTVVCYSIEIEAVNEILGILAEI